jgi:hypothetical protein
MGDFPASPKATFRLLDRLDVVFSSLLQGRNTETGDILPGFERGPAVSMTEKVRIKSLVEQTRIKVVNVMSSGGTEFSAEEDDDERPALSGIETEDEYGMGTSTMDDDMGDDDDFDEEGAREVDRREIRIAKVYDRTMVELGSMLGGTPIGIITDN